MYNSRSSLKEKMARVGGRYLIILKNCFDLLVCSINCRTPRKEIWQILMKILAL